MSTTPVPSQTPHDESDRRTEPRSSVSDLVNSLTSEMLMVRGWEARPAGSWAARPGARAEVGGRVGAVHAGGGPSVVTSSFITAAACASVSPSVQ